MAREKKFMQEAVRVGLEGMRNNLGGPFGCVIVKNNEIIGKGCNSVIATNDPTAHAEIVAIRDACKNLGTFQLTDCQVYTTCEPCPMCMGALYWARPEKIYYASSRTDAANVGFEDNYIYEQIALPAEQRKISTECLQCEEAKELFEEWKDLNNKLLY
jgi:guanine deaminase